MAALGQPEKSAAPSEGLVFLSKADVQATSEKCQNATFRVHSAPHVLLWKAWPSDSAEDFPGKADAAPQDSPSPGL